MLFRLTNSRHSTTNISPGPERSEAFFFLTVSTDYHKIKNIRTQFEKIAGAQCSETVHGGS